MNLVHRTKDVIFDNQDLEHLYTFKNFPVFMGCIDQEPSKDVTADMSWDISRKSGMVQLNPLLPLDVVYSGSHGSGTTGKLWNDHHSSFASFVSKFNVKNVLEIGGSHGALAKKYIEQNPFAKWSVVEPNPTFEETNSIKIYKRFFDNTFKCDQTFDAVVHSHVLEHVYYIEQFMKHKSNFMQPSSLLLFSVPNMEVMIKNNYTNCVNFEHTFLLTEPYIEFLLKRHGYSLVEKQYFMKDHSIFYCARKENHQAFVNELPEDLYDINRKLFINYIESHLNEVKKLNVMIEQLDCPVYLFGAHVFSQYLVSFGLNTEKIVCLLDNDLKKENKRLYGTGLFSKPPKILKDVGKAVIILRAGVYNEEVRNDILININSMVEFI